MIDATNFPKMVNSPTCTFCHPHEQTSDHLLNCNAATDVKRNFESQNQNEEELFSKMYWYVGEFYISNRIKFSIKLRTFRKTAIELPILHFSLDLQNAGEVCVTIAFSYSIFEGRVWPL